MLQDHCNDIIDAAGQMIVDLFLIIMHTVTFEIKITLNGKTVYLPHLVGGKAEGPYMMC